MRSTGLQSGLLIVGAGGHGRSVAEAALLSEPDVRLGFLDDGAFVGDAKIWGLPVLGPAKDFTNYMAQFTYAIVAIGNNTLRQRLCDELSACGFVLACVIHPRAIVSPRAQMGTGVAVMAGAIVGTEAQLGRGVIVNSGAVVDHHAQVHEFGHLGVNACMAGGSVLGERAWMKAGAAIGYGVHVPHDHVLEAGASLR
jgi:sugar O-acyltransferase (sialic acid O-acetyltransferase NeuD family)